MSLMMSSTDIKNKLQQRLSQIANTLVINASFTNNIGLFNGKTGISIFFYHYSSYIQNELYRNFADDLVDEIYEDITKVIPVDFADGLTGIGWGIEYLVTNKFVDADTDEALEEIDTAVLRYRLYNAILLSENDIVFGFGLYQLARLKNCNSHLETLNSLIKKENLIYLVDECERIVVQKTYLQFEIKQLKIEIVNSILYFLLEVKKMGLLEPKINKIIKIIIEEYIETNYDIENLLEKDIFIEQLSKMPPNFNGEYYKLSCNNIDNECEIGKHNMNDTPDKKEIMNIFSKISWYSMIYPEVNIQIMSKTFMNEVISIFSDDNWWKERLDNMDLSNIGINNGMAGIGLSMLNYLKYFVDNER